MTRTLDHRCLLQRSWVLAFVLAVWTFLAIAPQANAQGPDGMDPADAAALEARYASQSLRVSLWLNKGPDEIYRRGEPLSVTFQTNADAYAVLYHIDVEGRVTVLWPTSRYSDGFAFGGHEYRLPSRQGERLRVAGEEGQGFIQAVVSAYPFDLRDLELDFHHEPTPEPLDFYVAGDPYLAMNEVNFVVTGLEDPSEYAVSNHVSYYVHRKVDHPRYLCFQCHDSNEFHDPYRDTCTITVEYDYSWHNDWWDRYGYYPVYYYPVYVYVDPWAGLHWTNYWYDPWYRWPWSPWHHWSYSCYRWHHSPYWTHDVYVAQKHHERRYRPLDRDLVRQRDRSVTRTKSQLVRGERPADDRLRAMKERTVVAADRDRTTSASRDRIRGGGATLKPRTDRTSREQQRFEPQRTQRSSPGLRVDKDRTTRIGSSGSSRTTETTTPRVRADQRPQTRTSIDRGSSRVSPRNPRNDSPRVTPRTRDSSDDRRVIRPVEPRNDRDRVWSNRRSSGSSSSRPKSPPSTRSSRPAPRKQETVKPRSNTSRRDSGSSSSVRRPSSPPKRPSSPPPSQPKRGTGGSSRTKSRGGSGGRG
jgi:hypothetical protein